jgi:hypothetical protein
MNALIGISAAVNAVAVVVLVWVTLRYAKAAEELVKRVDAQLEAATEQSAILYTTAEILARSALIANGSGDNSVTVTRELAEELARARGRSATKRHAEPVKQAPSHSDPSGPPPGGGG